MASSSERPIGCDETSPFATLPWNGFTVCAVGWLGKSPAGICAPSRPATKTCPNIASPSNNVQAQGEIGLWLEYLNEIKFFTHKNAFLPRKWLPIMDAKKSGRVLLWIVSKMELGLLNNNICCGIGNQTEEGLVASHTFRLPRRIRKKNGARCCLLPTR